MECKRGGGGEEVEGSEGSEDGQKETADLLGGMIWLYRTRYCT